MSACITSVSRLPCMKRHHVYLLQRREPHAPLHELCETAPYLREGSRTTRKPGGQGYVLPCAFHATLISLTAPSFPRIPSGRRQDMPCRYFCRAQVKMGTFFSLKWCQSGGKRMHFTSRFAELQTPTKKRSLLPFMVDLNHFVPFSACFFS